MRLIKEIYDYREMVAGLVRRELRGRYKGSVLGFLWTFINPLLQLAVYTLVFSIIMRNNIDKYYLHLFVALVPWIFFSASLQNGASCILDQKDMVKKIYFPREVLPLSTVLTNFINMLFSFVIIFIVIIFSGVSLSLVSLLYLPLIMLIELILALGIAFLTSAITVYFRDMAHILGIISMAWMYMTPVMYPIDMVPERLVNLYMLNPMTPVIIAYRDILYFGRTPQLSTLGSAVVLGIFVLIIGVFVFQKLKKRFVEEL